MTHVRDVVEATETDHGVASKPNQNETGEGKMSDYDDWEIVDFKPP